MQNVSIRPVQSNEIDLLQKIAVDTFAETFASANTKENMVLYLEQAFNLERLTHAHQHAQTHYYFAAQREEVIGYLKLNTGDAQTEDLFDHSMEIERIYILPESFGKGVGQLLMDHAINFARSGHIRTIWLGVWEQNPRAVRFYEKNGFTVFGEHPYMMGKDEQIDLLMRFDL